MKNDKWDIIHECDGEDGEPACWAKEINHPQYGKYVWISKNSDAAYDVEVMPGQDVKVLATCRSLASAKRWAAMHLSVR